MILPIYAYGQPVLKKVAEDITKDYPELENLIANMWETMYNAEGVGLAAPQIGLPIRLFLVDTTGGDEEDRPLTRHSSLMRLQHQDDAKTGSSSFWGLPVMYSSSLIRSP